MLCHIQGATRKKKVSLPATAEMDVILPNGVIVYYSLKQTVAQVFQLVVEYKFIWHDEGFAKLPKENWIKIPLKSN